MHVLDIDEFSQTGNYEAIGGFKCICSATSLSALISSNGLAINLR